MCVCVYVRSFDGWQIKKVLFLSRVLRNDKLKIVQTNTSKCVMVKKEVAHRLARKVNTCAARKEKHTHDIRAFDFLTLAGDDSGDLID